MYSSFCRIFIPECSEFYFLYTLYIMFNFFKNANTRIKWIITVTDHKVFHSFKNNNSTGIYPGRIKLFKCCLFFNLIYQWFFQLDSCYHSKCCKHLIKLFRVASHFVLIYLPSLSLLFSKPSTSRSWSRSRRLPLLRCGPWNNKPKRKIDVTTTVPILALRDQPILYNDFTTSNVGLILNKDKYNQELIAFEIQKNTFIFNSHLGKFHSYTTQRHISYINFIIETCIHKFQQTILSDILKTKGKLKTMRDHNVDNNVCCAYHD